MASRRVSAIFALLVAVAAFGQQRGGITFESSDERLARGFEWAKKQALAYVFTGDPVGDWYEASLPGRQAFCMRDVSHQSTGAQALGLAPLTRNMLRRFAASIAESRDWCAYWEIDKFGRPAPVDYKNDKDFWFNLPANFDVLNCCYRQHLWTGDKTYIEDPAFLNFYDRTVNEYVKRWDKDSDGVPESYREYGHRGIGSYDEDLDFHVLVGSDLVASQIAAYAAYADLAALRRKPEAAARYRAESLRLRKWFNEAWWDAESRSFYRAMKQDRTFFRRPNGAIPEIWFDAVDPGLRTSSALARLAGENVEVRSYLPEVAYRYELRDTAYAKLMEMLDPALKRREYPEVSYAAVGAIVEGLMGVRPDARSLTVETFPRLSRETAWAALGRLPVFTNEVDVRHTGLRMTTLANRTGPAFLWRAAFPGRHRWLLVDGQRRPADHARRRDGSPESSVSIRVTPGTRRRVEVP